MKGPERMHGHRVSASARSSHERCPMLTIACLPTGEGTPSTDHARPCGTSPMAAAALITSATQALPECRQQARQCVAPHP
jgi:hypothetical protein